MANKPLKQPKQPLKFIEQFRNMGLGLTIAFFMAGVTVTFIVMFLTARLREELKDIKK